MYIARIKHWRALRSNALLNFAAFVWSRCFVLARLGDFDNNAAIQ
jgi:hypothetical protein